jgi:gas vesicle protein
MNDNHSSRSSGESFFSGLVMGAILGAGLVYFLTTTEEGKKIQGQLKEKGGDTLDNLKNLVDEVEKKGEEFKEKAHQFQAQLADKVKDTSEDGLSQIERLRERGRQAVKFFTRNGKPLS